MNTTGPRCYGCSKRFTQGELPGHVRLCEHVDMSWMERGSCLGMDADLFFPERGDNEALVAAKEVCRGCPVQVECLDHALRAGERWGVWAGTSERERYRMRRHMREAS
jgi:WhiB family transcriptional regulator, redox-sensing transcriptional regulator